MKIHPINLVYLFPLVAPFIMIAMARLIIWSAGITWTEDIGWAAAIMTIILWPMSGVIIAAFQPWHPKWHLK